MDDKKYHHIDIKDIDQWDLNLIKDQAINKFNNDPQMNDVHLCMVSAVLDFIHSKGCQIVKDENREDTWSKPKASWYTPYKAQTKNWWKK